MDMAFGCESRFLKDPRQKEQKAQGAAAFHTDRKKIGAFCLWRSPHGLLSPVGETTVASQAIAAVFPERG